VAAKKKAKPTKDALKSANAKAMGTYEKNHAAWKKSLDRKLAAINSGKGSAASKAKARAAVKNQMAASKPGKPTMGGDLAHQYG